MKHLRLLAALVEDAKAGSDAVALDEYHRRMSQVFNSLHRTLHESGNQCSNYCRVRLNELHKSD